MKNPAFLLNLSSASVRTVEDESRRRCRARGKSWRKSLHSCFITPFIHVRTGCFGLFSVATPRLQADDGVPHVDEHLAVQIIEQSNHREQRHDHPRASTGRWNALAHDVRKLIEVIRSDQQQQCRPDSFEFAGRKRFHAQKLSNRRQRFNPSFRRRRDRGRVVVKQLGKSLFHFSNPDDKSANSRARARRIRRPGWSQESTQAARVQETQHWRPSPARCQLPPARGSTFP